MTRLGRPQGSLGEIAQRALDYATGREVHVYELREALQLSRRDASVTLFNLRQSGHLVEVGRAMPPGARRPVPVVTAAPPATVEGKLAALGACLASWPTAVSS